MSHLQPVTDEVPVEGGSLHVARWGPEPSELHPVAVAAHGITSSHLSWAIVGELIGDDMTLLAPDLRGRGDSAKLPLPVATGGIEAHARDMVGILDHYGILSAVAAGHSMGAFVAAIMAIMEPERVDGVLLIDGGPPLTEPLAPDVDVDHALNALIGPALHRLRRTFPDQDAYRAFWSDHPALKQVPAEVINAYADHDLAGPEGAMHSKVNEDAVTGDARDTLLNEDVRTAVDQITQPVRLLLAERGILDQPNPLYTDEATSAAIKRNPKISASRIADTNHYTIALGQHGARAIAEQLRSLTN